MMPSEKDPTPENASKQSVTKSRCVSADNAGCCGGGCRQWRAVVTVAACMMIEATCSVSYTNGNLMPYLASYLRNVTGETEVEYSQMLWIGNVSWLLYAVSLPLIGLVEKRMRKNLFYFIGIALHGAAFFGTYWAVQSSFTALVLVNGLILGVAQAILYPASVNLAMQWFPHRKGLVGGITMSGYGGGAFIWNQVVTMWINPHNMVPDVVDGENRYFSQPEVLDRVPSCYLLLGGLLTATQLLCLLSFTYPPPPDIDHNINNEHYKDNLQETSIGSLNKNGSVEHTSIHNLSNNVNVNKNVQGNVSQLGSIQNEHRSPSNSTDNEQRSSCALFEEKPAGCELSESHTTNTNMHGDIQIRLPDAQLQDGIAFISTPFSKLKKQQDAKGEITTLSLKKLDLERYDVANGNSHSDEEKDGDVPCDASLLEERSATIAQRNYTPLEIVKTRAVWILFLQDLANNFCFNLIVGFYKVYGQTFIHDDHFLALVASLASVFNAIWRPLWGLLADRIGFLPALIIAEAILAVSSGVFVACESVGSSVMFLILVCAMYSGFSGLYALQSPTIFALFGPQHFLFSLGIISSSGIITTVSTVFISASVEQLLGWKGVFLISSACAVMAIVFLLSLLVSCGHPVPENIKSGLLGKRRRRRRALKSLDQQL